jgi:membrane complex biogenesis BtpA family protein
MKHLLASNSPRPLLIGVVHLEPLPGAHRFGGDVSHVLERARADARALAAGGVDAVIVENFGDAPFFRDAVPPATVASLTRAAAVAREELGERPVGVNVLRNDALAALGVCAATGASFLRVNVHVGAMVTDQGIVEGRAAEVLRERGRLAPEVALLADVHVKHATPLGSESLADAAEETFVRGCADALIVSGTGTGAPVSRADLVTVRERVPEAPLLIGSGLTTDNAAELLAVADGAIVGSSLERDGRAGRPVELERVKRLRAALDDPRA